MPSVSATARYYDGRVAAARPVRLFLEGGLAIAAPDGTVIDVWPLRDMEPVVRDDAGMARLARSGGAATVLCDDAALIAALRRRGAGRHAAAGRRGALRLAAWIAGAVGAVVLFFFVGLPYFAGELARALPEAWERDLGEATAVEIADLLARPGADSCDDPAGRAALGTMVAALTAAAPPRLAIRVRVVDTPMVNAFALPGGQVLVLRGLLDFTGHPNELAAVLAHEFAHNDLRHPTENAIKRGTAAFAVGVLMGDVFGTSAAVILGQLLVSAGYTREAEAAADAAMIDTLRRAGLATSPAAAFFDRLTEKHGGTPDAFALLETHPPTADRAARLRAAVPAGRPALDPAAWSALKAICGPPEPDD